ncbi:hypothetical protein WN55_03094 [Dufourea novaeangliae]|uniref:Uncharacterized protein n=1 Tax=Dufourea novaeangliae TaxID=178035 RepID=A0A154PHZ9_DUFNO|nr:hypothetical protein WN55_03094 [Dufourea novaeangliae]
MVKRIRCPDCNRTPGLTSSSFSDIVQIPRDPLLNQTFLGGSFSRVWYFPTDEAESDGYAETTPVSARQK